ncbi:pyruvate synthase subunit PorD [Candidatus Vecturithrix granuli]|uniref:Pyruvate synthase subunit PorD n=1 Tax=Vecturithrix granuli TaxID=1499967 RepID=A0A0S6WB22_VECG1|nr:pyruvate synthase subunit PorD [Candidatus Vecturithrix granuli]
MNETWQELPIGGLIVEPGNALGYHTSGWRAMRPIYHPEHCIQCFKCWIFCPDAAIVVKDEQVVGMNLDYCKGCGICAYECPGKKGSKAITMEEEAKFLHED